MAGGVRWPRTQSLWGHHVSGTEAQLAAPQPPTGNKPSPGGIALSTGARRGWETEKPLGSLPGQKPQAGRPAPWGPCLQDTASPQGRLQPGHHLQAGMRAPDHRSPECRTPPFSFQIHCKCQTATKFNTTTLHRGPGRHLGSAWLPRQEGPGCGLRGRNAQPRRGSPPASEPGAQRT